MNDHQADEVTIPREFAVWVVKYCLSTLPRHVRDGASLPADVGHALTELHRATLDPVPQTEPEHARSETMVTTTEMAVILGCSTRYIRRLAGQGRLPARKIGGQWMISGDVDDDTGQGNSRDVA
ncbi:hypothetical protein FDG2_1691 [Candidatus Protofrankia californiensis]|uniref:Helix-turn-helix domain-containing protein n=1 Tax=Candidatus Protofrankia californiensis TaxID=1839754 RepID=A0A1C3NW56_9ACTN|nr:hypothetical protein FDG2_1691 [Candidatus Protofrankia californiensis]